MHRGSAWVRTPRMTWVRSPRFRGWLRGKARRPSQAASRQTRLSRFLYTRRALRFPVFDVGWPLHRIDRPSKRDIGIREAVRDMCGEDDADRLVALEMDVGVVVRRIRGLGHPVHERHGSLEALEREDLSQGCAVPSPAGARGEEGSER